MEITDFVTQNFLSSFAGTLISVELIVFITKSFPLIKKIPTKFYTFILAVIHLVIVRVSSGSLTINVENIYILFINSLVVVLILCGGYDTIMIKIKGIMNNVVKAQEDLTEIINTTEKVNEIEKNNSSNE